MKRRIRVRVLGLGLEEGMGDQSVDMGGFGFLSYGGE